MKSRFGILIGIVLFAAVAALWWFTSDRDGHRAKLARMLPRAIAVVAAAEEERYEAAIQGWDELLREFPDNPELLSNQAVTVLKWITETHNRLSSGTITDPELQRKATAELQTAYTESDRILKKLSGMTSDGNGNQALLESALLEAKARSLAFPEDVKIRKQAADKLVASLSVQPAQPLLAARLLDLAQDLSADHPELSKQATDALFASWKANPRNLFLLVRTGESMVADQDPRLIELLPESLTLAQPLLSMLGPAVAQLQPNELLPVLTQSIRDGDWSKGPRLRQWFNVLRGSTAFRADMRRVKPDIMALLGTRFLQQWRSELASDSAIASRTLTENYQATKLTLEDSDTKAPLLVGWYDYDIDLDFDVLLIQGNRLQVIEAESGLPKPESTKVSCQLPFQAKGFCIVDLWEVDSPQRPRKNASNTALKNDQQESESSLETSSSRHDTLQEVIVWNDQRAIVVTRSLEEQKGSGTEAGPGAFQVVENVPGLDLVAAEQVVALDFDSDGDLDLVGVSASGMTLLQNNGNRTFQLMTQYSQLPPSTWKPTRMVVVDFDRDLDLDVVMSSQTEPKLAWLENILHSQFRFGSISTGGFSGNDASSLPSTDLAVAELNSDASWDLVVSSDTKLQTWLTRTPDTGIVNFESSHEFEIGEIANRSRLQIGDANNDGFVDAWLATEMGLRLALGDGAGGFVAAKVLGAQDDHAGVELLDADLDGRIDALAVCDGTARIYSASPDLNENATQGVSAGPPSKYLEARVRGINDNNGGGRINHYAIGSVLEVWAGNRFQSQVISQPMTHFGLGADDPLNLRIIFNNGLTQNAENPSANTLLEEVQELRGSCPFVYGFNGQRFEMITDLLWNAPLGLQVGRGKVLPDRRWEYLLLPGELVQPKDNAVELRITEELYEIAYFDHVQLTAIDHPEEVELWTNEKVGPPSIAQPRLFGCARPIRPIRVRDGHGRDQLAAVIKRDGHYAQAFDGLICQGLAKPHSLDFEFDPSEFRAANDIRLVLTGWMYPTDTSLNIGIEQNQDLAGPSPPSLWTPDGTGEFQCVQPFMGFPGGKPKTIVVDLSNMFSTNDYRVRLTGSQQIYWDQAYIVVNEPPVPMQIEELRLLDAELRYRGFSRLLPRRADQPHWYDYEDVSTKAKWPPLQGPFTRFGSVAAELRADDDRMVVMTSGDDIRIRFQLPSKPLRTGWKRDYVLHSVGWDKDADANTLAGDGTLPLPFKNMKSYPPSLEDLEESQRVLQLNSDTLTNRSNFRQFWYSDR